MKRKGINGSTAKMFVAISDPNEIRNGFLDEYCLTPIMELNQLIIR